MKLEVQPMEEKKKTPGELRREALCCSPKNGYDRLEGAALEQMER